MTIPSKHTHIYSILASPYNFTVDEHITYKDRDTPTGKSSYWAFKRKPLWKALGILAIVVDHVVLLNPLYSLLPRGTQWLGKPCLFRRTGRRGRTRGRARRPNACLGVEVSVRGCEGGFAPICLNKSTTCCPVICIPKAWVYPHCLVLWEWDSPRS